VGTTDSKAPAPLFIADLPPGGILLPTAEDTQALAQRIGRGLGPEASIALTGDLGAGKTTFVQGLARAYGITRHVTSPTFNILLSYAGTGGTLHHLDAYRLQPGTDPETICPPEFLVPPYCLCIEWPERSPDLVPPATPHLHLSIEPDGKSRRLTPISDVFSSSNPTVSP